MFLKKPRIQMSITRESPSSVTKLQAKNCTNFGNMFMAYGITSIIEVFHSQGMPWPGVCKNRDWSTTRLGVVKFEVVFGAKGSPVGASALNHQLPFYDKQWGDGGIFYPRSAQQKTVSDGHGLPWCEFLKGKLCQLSNIADFNSLCHILITNASPKLN